ncbi:MAG: YkgJ family cysteine cluster protein [Gemmataceae bacterium]|nr:YkgJ family cysteine cluster protein [Gemmataceae bacterium]MCI0738078.1 YkgJ family cysteine cluster protein [Gemmataceae bacterium]
MWFRDGLRFECTRCGHCCTGAPGYVWINDAELNALAEFLREPRAVVEKVYTRQASRGRSLREKSNGDCVFYDKAAGCTIYPVRPTQCRTWPFWESNLESHDSWKKTCQVCPGSGQGELIDAEEIVRRLKAIRV